ncbi:hypothetical protein XPA_004827 [Xanthoria parietina]
MPGIASGLYNALFRRNVVFLTTVFAGAFAFEIGFDTGLTKIWDWNNKGVRFPAPSSHLRARN